ncbi:hypothetical protein [Priestia koreensis]|uniref:hypothetical protein n=1 Tax=Priestia koreensis TaxID=284581 RepID=UPI00203B7EA0|nr:hypothetical protein [Priestia koreensis]MCM3005838.1 hypothetical protein [Priestia koreensis]
MLKLVIDNEKKEELLTCRSCSLYDPISDACGIWSEADINDPILVYRCEEYIPNDLDDSSNPLKESYSFTEVVEVDNDPVFYQMFGQIDMAKNYPAQPEYHPKRDDVTWYVNREKQFGCWILNTFSKRFLVVRDESPVMGWHKNVYKSPYPLHDHDSSPSIAPFMCWFVDEDGYGQYVLLVEGEKRMITAPRPKNFR